MCYYNGIKVSGFDRIRLLQLEKEFNDFKRLAKPVGSGFDYSDWPVIRPNATGDNFEIDQMEWGFLPSYLRNRDAVKKFRFGYKDEGGKFHPPMTTLNAMGEELLLPGKMYREAALKRRCLALSTGFFEWRHVQQIGKKGQPLKATAKYPYHIDLKDQPYFFIASIWQTWTDKDTGEIVDTFALVTTKANTLMEQVHNSKKRQPTILNAELAYEWILGGDLSEKRITEIATYQMPAEEMQACAIAKDFKEALDPYAAAEYAELPALLP